MEDDTARSSVADAPVQRITADEEYELEINGFRCPDEFVTFFTPLEFEELVTMFQEYDANGNGTLDIYEIRKILYHMDMEMSKENAQELMDLIDVDGSGEIDFDEYCGFIALTKQGDEKFTKFNKLLEKMGDTPLGVLEQQAKARHFSTRFFLVEEREATATTPPLVVVELLIEGLWHTRENGVTTSRFETKRFQGMGPNSKHAKDAAIKVALVKLRNYMPGASIPEGEFPDEWLKWVNDNICRGVPPMEIIDLLVQKGFKPTKNTPLMHKLVASCLFDEFQEKHPDFDPDDMSQPTLDMRFSNWIKRVGDTGIDGQILLTTLEDRGLEIARYHPYIADKMRFNEFSSLMEKDGKAPKFLDFWQACADGFAIAVELYIRGDMEVDLEKMGRFGSISRTGLMLAAMGNHPKCVDLLINGKATVSLADRRGRTALHYAALHGSLECCNLLMDAGAALFQGDHQGNTALHLATWQNHPPTVDFLCFKGQEFTRSITADKIPVRKGGTFNQLAQEIFLELQEQKLRPVETRRFQKSWIHEAACLFREKMDQKVRHMLAPTCVEIMEDVLYRFDPRPETGIFVSTATEGEQLFIPTIPTAVELGVLLRYMFRQSALDCTNNWNRTALHLAADENCVASHLETIRLLADKHGCNVMLKDMHNRTPYDLLVMDKVSPKNPTATSVREYLLFETRVAQIKELTDVFDNEDRVVLEERRQKVLDECIRRGYHMNYDLWEATRAASLLMRTHNNKWNYYIDPDTKNGFYCKQPFDPTLGDPFTDWNFKIPDEVRASVHRDLGWEFHRNCKSEVVRQVGDWVTMKCLKTGCLYYYNVETKEYTFKVPGEYDWKLLAKEAKYIESYGYSEEWQEFVVGTNFFYFEKNRKFYRWLKPLEAVTVTPSEKFCTGYKKKNRRIDQKWYTCEQCNIALKELSGDDSEKKIMIKICEPCVNRCHRGHKGTRLVRISPISCQCSSLCHEFCPCKALEISQYQLNVMKDAAEHRQEERRIRMHDALMPPVFAYCPRLDRNGNLKRESGYTMCRRKPPVSIEDIGEKVVEFGDSTVISEMPSATLDGASSSYFDDDDYSTVGSLHAGESGRISRTYLQLAESNFDLLVPDDFREYSRLGWIQVLDPEIPDEIEIGARVLCIRQFVTPRCYGTVIQKMRRGVYKVQFTKEGDTENISTEKMEVLTKPHFYFNKELGLSTWELPKIKDEEGFNIDPVLPQSEELEISGNDWLALKLVGAERRTFKNYEEFEDPYSKLVFYVHIETHAEEHAALKIQNLFRYRRRKAKPRDWTSTAFTFTKPEEVFEEERVKAAWALLRRRATCLGEFMDVDYYEWEELMDQESADFFYWQEDMDAYSWDKPPVPKSVFSTKIKPLELGEKVTHKFPGKNGEEICTVIRIRQDDETNEDMYDLQHGTQEDLRVKWVPRYRIKKLAKSGDELILALSAVQWKKQIRRQREKEKRMRAAARQKRIEEEKIRRGKTVVSKISGTASMSIASSADEVERARILRSRAEKLQLKEEKDAIMLAKREVAIAALMDDMAKQNKKLSKSELISLQRSITLKLEVEALMEKRTKAQNLLLGKRTQAKARVRLLESSLRTQEDLMTTPRSSIRRRLLRQMHFAILRQLRGQVICEWGCGDWVKLGQEQQDHQLNYCSKRIVSCALGCSKRLTEDEWLAPYVADRDIEAEENEMGFAEDQGPPDPNAPVAHEMTYQEHHEIAGCPKRLQPCPRQCLEWVTAEELEFHMNELCVKRDAKPLECRQGCGMMFGGIVETMIQAEDERFEHEQEECPFRQVRCNWRFTDGSFCAAQMCATERDAHRDSHIERMGISTYTVPGTYVYKVEAKCNKIKIQMWGAGGGSGHFKERRGGNGGGGAFVEIFINVNPFDVLEIVVGHGGQAGVYGTELEAIHNTAREEGDDGSVKTSNTFDVIDASYGVALGGLPGGGDGSGGGGRWAAGGGGGYTIVSKRTREGSQVIAVAGGGGGGGSQDGIPGCGMEGALPGTRVDIRNGGCAIGEKGGAAGDSGNVHNADFAATPGEMWQGGNGSQYGGGGGGGYAGGGGGGTSPGIGGGGGGGSSFIYLPLCRDYLIIHGHGKLPGGIEHDPPEAVGVGEWDKIGGLCGEGGTGHPTDLHVGNGGAVRILKPGFFKGGEEN